jgi:hypothetical protein
LLLLLRQWLLLLLLLRLRLCRMLLLVVLPGGLVGAVEVCVAPAKAVLAAAAGALMLPVTCSSTRRMASWY